MPMESRLKPDGTRIRTMSTLRRFGKAGHIVPTTLLVRVQRFRLVWLVLLKIYAALAVLQPYRDLEAGDIQSL